MPWSPKHRTAGHSFGLNGTCELPNPDGSGSVCGRKWTDIRHCGTDEYIGQSGIAHHLQLNAYEAGQIRSRRAEEDEFFARLLSGRIDEREEGVEAVDTAGDGYLG